LSANIPISWPSLRWMEKCVFVLRATATEVTLRFVSVASLVQNMLSLLAGVGCH
jgi:hypothetical protein